MRHGRSTRARAICALVAALSCASAWGADWKRLGSTGVAAGFAGPVGRPVDDAWFSADGRRLFAAVGEGDLWSSADAGLTWSRSAAESAEPRAALEPAPFADGAFLVVRNPYRSGVSYALGEHLYRSDDGGGTWTNLTAVGGESVIGRWQSALAISPADPELIVIGNSMGVWKSHDAGVTWSSLNGGLPNFPESRFRRSWPSTTPTLETAGLGTLDLVRTPGGSVWRASSGPPPGPQRLSPLDAFPPALPAGYRVTRQVWRDGRPISGDLIRCGGEPGCSGHSITAFAANGQLWAGTSNGRIWTSRDDGATWSLEWTDPHEGAIRQFWTDRDAPATALAIAGRRVLRSTNGGASWFDVGANLPEGAWTAVQGHLPTATAYVAGPQGVYFARIDLLQPGPAGSWTRISENLPPGPVRDLALEPLRGRLYAALPGYGVYWTRLPQVEEALRALSAADWSERPAAPGSLLTVFGMRAVRARAGGRPAPILDARRNQTQLQVPYGVEGQSLRLRLEGVESGRTVDLPLRDVAPAVFVVAGEPLVLNAGSGALVSWTAPAAPGSSVLVMAAGLGEVSPPWPAGVPSPRTDPPRPLARIEARLGGVPVQVVSAQLAPGYVGIYLVEVAVPASAAPGSASLVLSADGRRSNEVALAIGR